MALFGTTQLGNNPASIVNALAEGHEVAGLNNWSDDQIAGLLGYVEGLGATGSKQRARKKILQAASAKNNNIARETTDLTPKALFEQRLSQLPAEAQEKLRSGQWQLVPYTYYSAKFIGGVNHVDMFESGDMTIKGITNVVQGRMPAEDYFLCTAIRLRCGQASAATNEGIQNAELKAPIANVVNGEWMLAQESTTYIDKSAASVFDHSNQTNIALGIYELPTPKMFYPQRTIKAEFDMVGTIATENNPFMRLELIGVKTTKA